MFRNRCCQGVTRDDPNVAPAATADLTAQSSSSRGVADGTRTRDHRDHNPGLYQLSYRHLAMDRIASVRACPRVAAVSRARVGTPRGRPHRVARRGAAARCRGARHRRREGRRAAPRPASRPAPRRELRRRLRRHRRRGVRSARRRRHEHTGGARDRDGRSHDGADTRRAAADSRGRPLRARRQVGLGLASRRADGRRDPRRHARARRVRPHRTSGRGARGRVRHEGHPQPPNEGRRRAIASSTSCCASRTSSACTRR